MHPYTTYALKIQILVYSFTACQRCGVISESYKLQTRLLQPCATYARTLHVRVHFLRPTKDAELPPQSKPGLKERKVYKRQACQRQRINCFSYAFFSFCLPPHFLFCPSSWDNQLPAASHRSKRGFFGHLGTLTPFYNDGSASTLLL